MRYQFNSYSAPKADLDTLLSLARAYGYEGIELRLVEGHGHGIETSLDSAARLKARTQIAESGLRIDCLCTSVRLGIETTQQANLADCRDSIDLAGDLGVPFVRVFGGPVPDDVSRDQAHATLVAGLQAAGEHAATRGVTVLLETHDDWADPQHVAKVMQAVSHPNIGTLWDVWHTGRGGGATITDSYRALAPWIKHVQMHDGMLRPDRLDFRQIGTGEIDHLEVLLNLHADGYQGAISGEWIGWEPAEQHLPREIATMRHFESLIASATTAT